MKRKMAFLILLLVLLFASSMQAQIYVDVDTAVVLAVNKHSIQSDAGVIDAGVTYDETGIDLTWVFTPCAGPATATAIAPADSGNHEWEVLDAGLGMYSMQLPASGGTVDNDTEGSGYFTGNCTATLPWSSYVYIFRKASHNEVDIESGAAGDAKEELLITDWATAYDGTLNMWNSDMEAVDGTLAAATTMETYYDVSTAADAQHAFWLDATAAANILAQYDGTGYVGGTIVSQADITKIGGVAQSAADFKDFADSGYDPVNHGTNVYTVRDAAPKTAGDIATAVWNALTNAYGGVGTYGQSVEDTKADTPPASMN